MFLTQVTDLYDLSNELKKVHNQLVKANEGLKSKSLYGAIGSFNKALVELDLICESQNVCPYCGKDIVNENNKRECSGCGQKF